jgi:hypothetical protein
MGVSSGLDQALADFGSSWRPTAVRRDRRYLKTLGCDLFPLQAADSRRAKVIRLQTT